MPSRRLFALRVVLVVLVASVAYAAPTLAQPPIPLLDAGAAGFVGQAQRGPLDEPTLVASFGEFVALFGDGTDGFANPWLAPSAAAFFANGGERLWVVRVAGADDASVIGQDGGAPGLRTGLQALRDVDEVAVVAIPGNTSPAVQVAMIAHAENAGDRMALLDPISHDDLDAVVAQREGLGSAGGFAALYFPWIEAAPSGETLVLPPSGCVAGLFARTAPPDAPVGQVATASGVSYMISAAEQEIINPLGINAIRVFAGQGVLVWGARTLSSDPEWKYVPVRRVALNVEESIGEGTSWAVFEPNDEPLWAQLRAAVGDFLFGLWTDGWFQGASPNEAYFVRCDQTTMTQQDILEGRTVILVGFAPLRPAEFVILWIVHERDEETAVPPVPAASAPRIVAAAPNPFNPATTVQFELPAAAAVQLRVHDVAGRLVRTLVDGDVLPAGSHARRWDGRDETSRGVASGTYLVVLAAGGATDGRTVTLVE